MGTLVVVGVLGSVLVISAHPVAAAVAGTNGKIVYERDAQIWTMNADGSGQQTLVAGSAGFGGAGLHEPAWSPDGTKVAFRSSPRYAGIPYFNDDLWVVNADGSGAVDLTRTPIEMESNPAWSPDGSRIVYERDNEIWTMSADGSGQAVLVAKTTTPLAWNHEPAWSPDGTKIVYRRSPQSGEAPSSDDLWVVSSDGTGARNLTATTVVSESNPAWSPDGTSIAYERDGQIWTMNTDGSGQRVLVAGPPEAGRTRCHEPAWSPDGTKIAFRSTAQERTDPLSDDLWVANADGSGAVDLSNTALARESDPSWQALRRPTAVGMHDPSTGMWHLPNSTGSLTSFYFGNPGDVAFVGDWDCDGVDTPGVFRRTDASVHLRNASGPGAADLSFSLGNPSDVPLAGDFDGDGCDTVSVYRPGEQRFYVTDRLGEGAGAMSMTDLSFVFGDPADTPVVGDWDGDGVDEIGVYRGSVGRLFWRNSLDTGVASGSIYFGDPGDRFVAGAWGVDDATDAPGVFRPADLTLYLRRTLTQGTADEEVPWNDAGQGWMPVAGDFGLR